MKVTRVVKENEFKNKIAGQIGNIWSEQFKELYRTRHFLIFVTDPDIRDSLQLLVTQKEKGVTREDDLLRKLDDCIRESLIQLESYGPKELEKDDLASYWGLLANGKSGYQKVPDDGILDGLLSGVTLRWPRNSRYQIYDDDRERFSGWLYIKTPASVSSQNLLDKIFEVKHELSIYQTFATISKSESISFIQDKLENANRFVDAPQSIQLELSALAQRIQADKFSMVSHRWAIEIFADTLEELEQNIATIKTIIKEFGYKVGREKINQEALFWSRFPEYQKFNCRQRFLTSENASHFMTFATVGEGHDRCSWGDNPVAVFKTKAKSDYSLIFHASPEKAALGNAIIIGGSGSGKTTFISLLLSQCFKFPDFRILAFDRLAGMKIFTQFHDGSYQDFQKGLSINPLQLDDTAENKIFLNEWFQVLTGKTDEKSVEIIGKAIIQVFQLPKAERTLANIQNAFGLKEEGTIRSALERWLPGGAFKEFFNSKRDALNFENPLVAFDMTT
ncbi:MAG: hypothetical protein GY718_02525, partial [Lentisphaerae bacterium]|nr:hypothetical protein [Lentisphaerota bacterium]